MHGNPLRHFIPLKSQAKKAEVDLHATF